MSYKICAENDCDIFAEPGDLVRVTQFRTTGARRGVLDCTESSLRFSTIKTKETVLVEHKIEKGQHFTKVIIIEFENEFGLKRGFAGILGS